MDNISFGIIVCIFNSILKYHNIFLLYIAHMGDIQTTSYQAAQTYSDEEQNTNIFSQLPDQFVRFENGVYNPLYFYTSSREFNLSLFNKVFREEQLKRIAFYRNREQQRLEELNQAQPPPLNFAELSIGEHFIRMKNTFFDIWTDLRTKPISSQLFLIDNRLFYIGLFLVIIFVIYLIMRNLITVANGANG